MDEPFHPELDEAIAGYQALLHHHPEAALLLEADTGTIVEANPAALALYGRTREELRGSTPGDRDRDADCPVVPGTSAACFEVRHRLADGTARTLEIRTGPVTLAGSEFLHATLRDVTLEREQAEELQAYRDLFEALPVGVFTNTAGHEGRCRAANPALTTLLGAGSREAVLATPAVRLHQDPEERRRLSDELLARGEVRDREVALRTLDGRPFRAALTARAWTTADGETLFTGVLEDITRHKAAEQALLHERQVASALRRILGELLRGAPTPEALFEPVCRILVEETGLRLAWLGRLDDSGWLRPEAWAGEATDYLEGLVLGTDPDLPEGRGPGGQSLQTGEARVIQDIEADPAMQPWREHARGQGLRGAAALPFRQSGRVVGSLLVYAPERDYFTDDVIGLLQQASHALGFALDQHQAEQGRRQAERDLHASEQRYRSIITAMAEGVALHGPDGAIIATNPAARAALGLSEDQMRGRDSLDPRWRALREDGQPFPGEEHPAMVSLRTGEPVRDCIMGIEDPERGTRWIRINAEPLAGEEGPEGAVATFTDITEQRAMERDRDRLVRILESTPDFISIARPDGTVEYVNEGGRGLLGLAPFAEGPGERLPAADLENHSTGDWAHPDWAARRILEEGIPAARAHGQWEGESALLDLEGREIPVSQVILAHYEADGEVSRLSTIMRDIRRQKELQQALADRQRFLQRLQEITGDPDRGLEEKLVAILELGVEVFDLPWGILSHIRGQDYRVRQAVSPDGSLAPGQRFDLGITYCVHTLEADGPAGFHHAGASSIRDHPCYRTQGMEAYLGVPVRVGNEVYGTLNFSRPAVRAPYSDFEWELIQLMGQWVGYELTREADRRELERLATHDALTGIANRARLYELLDAAREECERYGTPFAVILFDLDHFKAVNDQHGHAVGDAVLQEVTQRVAATLREADRFGRWGGEEFLILTGHVHRAGAESLAERVRRAVAAEPFTRAGRITLSLGVAGAQPGESLENLEERADRALYAAKAAGRNRVRRG